MGYDKFDEGTGCVGCTDGFGFQPGPNDRPEPPVMTDMDKYLIGPRTLDAGALPIQKDRVVLPSREPEEVLRRDMQRRRSTLKMARARTRQPIKPGRSLDRKFYDQATDPRPPIAAGVPLQKREVAPVRLPSKAAAKRKMERMHQEMEHPMLEPKQPPRGNVVDAGIRLTRSSVALPEGRIPGFRQPPPMIRTLPMPRTRDTVLLPSTPPTPVMSPRIRPPYPRDLLPGSDLRKSGYFAPGLMEHYRPGSPRPKSGGNYVDDSCPPGTERAGDRCRVVDPRLYHRYLRWVQAQQPAPVKPLLQRVVDAVIQPKQPPRLSREMVPDYFTGRPVPAPSIKRRPRLPIPPVALPEARITTMGPPIPSAALPAARITGRPAPNPAVKQPVQRIAPTTAQKMAAEMSGFGAPQLDPSKICPKGTMPNPRYTPGTRQSKCLPSIQPIDGSGLKRPLIKPPAKKADMSKVKILALVGAGLLASKFLL